MRIRPVLVVGTATAVLGMASPATAATFDSTLTPGTELETGDVVVSDNGQQMLGVGPEIGSEGLILGGGCATDVLARVPVGSQTLFTMQDDGNLVLYADGNAVWNSGTAGHPDARAVLQDDRNIVVYNSADQVLWNAGTVCNQLWNSNEVVDDAVANYLQAESFMQSPNREFKLIMQSDGNLVLYKGTQALWATNTFGEGNTAIFQEDGTLQVADPAGRALWGSHTGQLNRFAWPQTLVLQDDGNLVSYTAMDQRTRYEAKWATNTRVNLT